MIPLLIKITLHCVAPGALDLMPPEAIFVIPPDIHLESTSSLCNIRKIFFYPFSTTPISPFNSLSYFLSHQVLSLSGSFPRTSGPTFTYYHIFHRDFLWSLLFNGTRDFPTRGKKESCGWENNGKAPQYSWVSCCNVKKLQQLFHLVRRKLNYIRRSLKFFAFTLSQDFFYSELNHKGIRVRGKVRSWGWGEKSQEEETKGARWKKKKMTRNTKRQKGFSRYHNSMKDNSDDGGWWWKELDLTKCTTRKISLFYTKI